MRTTGPATRTRSRVNADPISPAVPRRSSTPARLFDVSPIEGALCSMPPLVIDCAESHARDVELSHAHAVPLGYLERRARQHSVEPHSIITANTRRIVINWLVEVTSTVPPAHVPTAADETLFLAVSYLDRFLQNSPRLEVHQLQLVGVTSLLIGAPRERIVARPRVRASPRFDIRSIQV